MGRWLGHENRALMNGIIVLIKEIPRGSLASSTTEDIISQQSATQKRALPTNQPCQHPNLGLPVPTTVGNKVLLFISHLVYDVCDTAQGD